MSSTGAVPKKLDNVLFQQQHPPNAKTELPHCSKNDVDCLYQCLNSAPLKEQNGTRDEDRLSATLTRLTLQNTASSTLPKRSQSQKPAAVKQKNRQTVQKPPPVRTKPKIPVAKNTVKVAPGRFPPLQSLTALMHCPTRFSGEHDNVAEFIKKTTTFKKVHAIQDADALRSMPLVLEKVALYWWIKNESTVSSWDDMTQKLRAAFTDRQFKKTLLADFLRRPSVSNYNTIEGLLLAKQKLDIRKMLEPHVRASKKRTISMLETFMPPHDEMLLENVQTYQTIINNYHDNNGLKRPDDNNNKAELLCPFCGKLDYLHCKCGSRNYTGNNDVDDRMFAVVPPQVIVMRKGMKKMLSKHEQFFGKS